MLLKSIVLLPLLTTSGLTISSCEIQEPYLGPAGVGAKSIKVYGGDSVDKDCILMRVEDEQYVYIVVDQECDGQPDYVQRTPHGRRYMTRPGHRDMNRGTNQPVALQLEMLVDDSLHIEGELESPFATTTPLRWMHRNGLHDVEAGEAFVRPLRIHSLSTESGQADVTIGMTSDMMLPRFDHFDLRYAWFTAVEPVSELECWSVRVQGELSQVVRWLDACNVTEIVFDADGSRWTFVWNTELDAIEVRRDGALRETIPI